MSAPRIVVTDHAFPGVAHEQALAARWQTSVVVRQCVSEEETIEAVAGADIVFVNFAPVTRRVLQSMSASAVVIRYGIGYDNVDVAAARELGIRVCNVPDYGVDTVADHTVACLLALLRRTGSFTSAVRTAGWLTPADIGPLRGFAQTIVGLVGTGRIGRAVAARLQPFGFRVVAFDPYVQADDLASLGIEATTFNDVIARSHAVSLHAPLTEANRGLMDAATLAAMPPGSVLVNTSRGGLIDEAALVEALRSGHLAGAALDVFDPEPLAPVSALRELDDVILTPHVAFYSDSSLDALQRLASEEAERALMHEPLRCPIV
ncbi:C-terminal binding protein [Microbacterium sp. 10M-3C3]|uniref:C-terminal binding protein n=1 Tax=Microbacterium sp. 10M-3C3 TaxID=2483401 RepID=UPI000F636DC0|nr:C-terminal binding protein [Microbacterium sp. 10M-3C3]